MLKKLLCAFSVALLFSGCAMAPKKSGNAAMSVNEVSERAEREKVQIDIDDQLLKTQVGPAPHDHLQSDPVKVKLEPAIALVLPSSSDIIPATLGLVRELSKNGITPRIYAGVGMGAVMATALAFNLSADEIEWELFSQERKGVQSERDKAQALINKFKDKDLSQSFHVVKIPSTKGVWFSRGNVQEMLNPHLGTDALDSWRLSVSSNKYNADIVWQITSDKAQKQVARLKEKIQSWKESQKQE
tara:strand:+ start:5949 stop:6680 length:732 start_codon:yes stop_codon:yes gene_type:complete